MAKTAKVNLRLERDMYLRLQNYARRTDQSMGRAIRQALDKFLPKAKQ